MLIDNFILGKFLVMQKQGKKENISLIKEYSALASVAH